MDIKLKRMAVGIINEIQRDLDEFESLQELFQLDLKNVYPIDEKESTKYIQSFRDDSGILNVMKARDNEGFLEIKFYWIDKTGKPTFDRRLTYDPKALNTFLSLFFNHFLDLSDAFLLQPNDIYRLRLFRMALNKYLDREKWDMKANESQLKIIIFKKDSYVLKEMMVL